LEELGGKKKSTGAVSQTEKKFSAVILETYIESPILHRIVEAGYLILLV